jgi:predicted nucleic acid-binding protein
MIRSIAGASRLYVDSNVLIYMIEGLEPYAGLAARTFEIAGRSGALMATSELTAAECMIRPFREKNWKLIRSYERLFENRGDLALLAADYGVIKMAAELGGAHRLKLVDAIHVATAVAAGCEIFLTNDKESSVPDGIEIVQLSQIESGS